VRNPEEGPLGTFTAGTMPKFAKKVPICHNSATKKEIVTTY